MLPIFAMFTILGISRSDIDVSNFPVGINVNVELNRVAADLAVFVIVLAASGYVNFSGKLTMAVRAGNIGVS